MLGVGERDAARHYGIEQFERYLPGSGRVDCCRDGAHGRFGEQCGQRDSGIETCENSCGAERVTTELEERVLAAHPLDAEDICEYGGHAAFGIGLRCHVFGVRRRGGRRQCAAVDLAARGGRQCVECDDVAGNHPRGQSASKVAVQHCRVAGDVEDKSVVVNRRRGCGHRRARRYRGFDFPEFESPPVQLDLLVAASEVFEGGPVDGPPDDVAGAVEPRSGQARVCDEPRRGGTGLSVVSTG